MSPLLALLATIGGAPPPAIVDFDDLAYGTSDSNPRGPEFTELSVHVGESLAPWRLTHYFDTDADAPARIAEVGGRLARIAAALGVALPGWLAALLAGDALLDPSLRQLALGVDVRPDPAATRLKLYGILRGDGAAISRRICGAAGLSPGDPGALEYTHIIGVDLGRDGLRDLKLYTAIDPRRAPRTLRRPGPWVDLLGHAQSIVYQRSLVIAGRQSMHIRVDAPAAIWRALGGAPGRARAAPELDAALDRLGVGPGGGPLQPWIIAFPYGDGALDPGIFNLYLHPTDQPAAPPRP